MPNTVTVKSGDTLSAIAKQYGVSTSSISGYRSGDPNLIYPGEVLNLSSTGASVPANNIQPPVNVNLPTTASKNTSGTGSLFVDGDSITKQVDKYRKQLDSMIKTRTSEVDAKLKIAQDKEKETLGKVETLTQPFRQDLETTERERLYINQNFEANQGLINELDTLLTQGNALITQQQQVTGLASVRNPRIQKTMDDVAARAGVIEAVINARNGQISVAENMIDRSVDAIAADRKDQLSYYETVLNLNNRDIVSLDAESKKLADYQVSLIKDDMDRAAEVADYVKKLLVDPATASLMGEAGVSLNDNINTINAKLTTAQHNRDLKEFSNEVGLKGGVAVVDPSSVPADQLITYTDASGTKHYYKLPKDSGSGSGAVIASSDPRVSAWVTAIRNGAATLSQVPESLKTSVAAAIGSGGNIGLTFEQYLKAAEETSSMSFTPEATAQLKQQYEELNSSAKGGGTQTIADWASSIKSGYATLAQVPDEQRAQVLRVLAESE